MLSHNEIAVYNDLSKKRFPGHVVSYSHLRIENKITNTKSVYSFPILTQGSEVSTEVKLDKNDLFTATKIGFFIYERNTSLLNEGKQALQSYPNESYFSTGTNFVKSDLETAYNGFLNFKKGTTTFVEKLDTGNFRDVSDTQQSSGTNKSSRRRDTGYIELLPSIDLPGRDQVTIEGTFPVFNGIQWQSDATNIETRMVLIARGFLTKGTYAN